jgi:serine/threonine-protein kinase
VRNEPHGEIRQLSIWPGRAPRFAVASTFFWGAMMGLADWTTRFLAGAQQDKVAAAIAPDAGGGMTAAEPARQGSDLAGTRIGAYLITKRLGAGGVGEVFKGVDEMLKRDVAIKVLRHELGSDPVFLARFRNEAQLHAKLSHPNVASVHAFLQEGDKQFLVMEFVPGISLDEFVRAGGPVPVDRALEIFRRTLDGVEHAHSHGIVHRDIKPANIMLADSGQVKVMDFGIARAMDSQERLTRLGHVAGTAKAMSPEQIRGQQADRRSDIYSLGIVLYTLLAGRAPFDADDDLALMKAQVEQAPRPLRDHVDDLPPKVEAAVMKALQKDPADRFQTVREFARAIDDCLAERSHRSAAGPDRALDAPTLSRTAINPALQGVKQLPRTGAGLGAMRSPAAWPRWLRLSAVSLAVAAPVGVGLLLWPGLLPGLYSNTGPQVVAAAPPAAVPAEPVYSPPPATVVAEPAYSPPPPAARAAPAEIEPAPQVAAAPLVPPASPPPLRGLSITRLGVDGKAAAEPIDGGHRFRPGERIRLLITPTQEAHVYCYLQHPGQGVMRFYPNRSGGSSLVTPTAPLEVPGTMPFEFVADSVRVSETVACFASERDVAGLLPPSVIGKDFATLPSTSLDDVRRAFARVAGTGLAEARLRIDVR